MLKILHKSIVLRVQMQDDFKQAYNKKRLEKYLEIMSIKTLVANNRKLLQICFWKKEKLG